MYYRLLSSGLRWDQLQAHHRSADRRPQPYFAHEPSTIARRCFHLGSIRYAAVRPCSGPDALPRLRNGIRAVARSSRWACLRRHHAAQRATIRRLEGTNPSNLWNRNSSKYSHNLKLSNICTSRTISRTWSNRTTTMSVSTSRNRTPTWPFCLEATLPTGPVTWK